MRSCLFLIRLDLPAADPDRVKQQIEDVIGLDAKEAVLISKNRLGIPDVLEAIVNRLPPPVSEYNEQEAPYAPLKAMLVDSWYDTYLGIYDSCSGL